MKLKLLSVFLLLFVLCGIFFLVKYTANIENPTENETVEEISQTGEIKDENAVSRTFVIKCAHDVENFFSRLATSEDKSFIEALPDLADRLEKSADYLKNEAQDYYGAAYFAKLGEIFKAVHQNPFASAQDFSARMGEYLKAIDASFPAEEAANADENSETNPMYYPKLNTSASGTVSLGFLSIYQAQKKAEGKLIITVGGNIVFGDTVLTQDSENSFKNQLARSSVSYPFGYVSAVLQNDNVSFANLESPLTESTSATTVQGAIKGLPEYADILKKSSIDGVTLSNSGVNVYGESGKADTKAALTKAEVSYSDEGTVCYFDTLIGKAALLTYDIIDESAGKNVAYKDAPKNDIAAARANGATVVVVNFNWINSYKTNWDPSLMQIYTARAAVDNGANLVYSTHMNNLEGIEKYNGVYLIYSAGDLSNKNGSEAKSILFQQEFTVNEQGITLCGKASIFPIRFASTEGVYANDGSGMPYLMLGSNEVEAFKSELANISHTCRYGLNKKPETSMNDIDIISISK